MQQKNCSEIVLRESEFQRGQTNKMAPSVHSDESIEASSNFFLFKFNLQNLGISKEKSSMQSFTCLLQNLQEQINYFFRLVHERTFFPYGLVRRT